MGERKLNSVVSLRQFTMNIDGGKNDNIGLYLLPMAHEMGLVWREDGK